jgi:hypothetical protein
MTSTRRLIRPLDPDLPGFSELSFERRMKPTIVNAATGEWADRPFILTIINGRIVSDLPELGAEQP